MRAALCLTFLSATLAAQELPLDLLPPDSAVVIGVNITRIRASGMWKQIAAELQARNPGIASLSGQDLYPLNEIEEILIAAPGRMTRQRGLFLMRIQCDDSRLRTFLPAGRRAAESPSSGYNVFTFENKGAPLSLACLDSGIMAGGDPASLKAALARGYAGGPNRALADTATALRNAHDFWVVARGRLSEFGSQAANQQTTALLNSNLMKSLEQISAGFTFTGGLRLSLALTARTREDAETFAGGFVMLMGMLKSDPKQAARFAPIVDRTRIRTDGTTVHLDMHVTEDEYGALMGQLGMPGAAAGASARGAASPATMAPGAEVQQRPVRADIVIQSSPKDMGTVTLPPPKNP